VVIFGFAGQVGDWAAHFAFFVFTYGSRSVNFCVLVLLCGACAGGVIRVRRRDGVVDREC
jgi:hypothetical protein